MHGLEQEWSGRVQFVYLDIDDPRNDPLKRQLSYRYQPHFYLFDGDGNIVEQWVGYVTAEELEAAFARVAP